MTAVVPFLKWAGGKRWFVPRHMHLFNCFHTRYVEPFLGSGAAFFHVNPVRALLSDTNVDLIRTYHTIRDDWKSVVLALDEHQLCHDRSDHEHYYMVRSSIPKTEVEAAARFIYLNRTCYNGLYRVNLKGVFNVPKGTKNAVLLPTDNFEEIARRLSTAEVVQEDFEGIIERCGGGDLVFIDPPYTVKHNNNGFLKYNEHIFSWEDQKRLAGAVRRLEQRGGLAIMTNAAHESIKDLYQDFCIIRTSERFSVLASKAQFRAVIEEYVIFAGPWPNEIVMAAPVTTSHSARSLPDAAEDDRL